MKKLYFLLTICVFMFIVGCEGTLELDLLDDPNNPSPETADLESLYNSVQNEFEDFISAPQIFTSQLCRHIALTDGSDYQSAFGPTTFDNIWTQAYSGFLPDANAVIERTTATSQFYHTGSTKIMQGYVLMTMVDLFGDVPLGDVGQGIDAISPAPQSGESVYAEALALVREGITELEMNTAASPNIDLMYSSEDGWIAAGNSLLLKAAVNMRDNEAFNAIIDSKSYIAETGLDWQWQYGSSRDNPDSRHPFYVDHYEAADGRYLSNWLMWAMTEDKEFADPRTRSYFYRQVPAIPLYDPNRFDCIFSTLPDASKTPEHYLNCADEMPYCVGSIDQGYYGRDHGNGNGIPPDGDIRTRFGVYPAGGKFDADTFIGTQNLGTDGGLGAGIHPLMPSFYIDFFRAEMALVNGNEAEAREHLLNGVTGSINKVIEFTSTDQGSLDEFVYLSPILGLFGSDFLPSQTAIDTFIGEVANRYDVASNKMDVVGLEFLIASFGNGVEGYNFIRRTGSPSNIQPAILPTAGEFVRSALYPAVHVNLNQNATQKSTADRVFWDNGNLGQCFN